MVVLVVGIISGVAMLSLNVGGGERYLREESDRLAALLEQAANEAVMQNQEYGLKVTDKGYAFLCLDEAKQRWKPCTNNSSFREREMPEGLVIHLLREGKMTIPLQADKEKENSKSAGKDDEPRINPDVFLLSSGEASPASLEIQVIEKPELKSEIRIDEIGRVSREGEEPEDKKNAG